MAKFLELENVEQSARANPETFFIPTASERENQDIGDSVRLHFLLASPSEEEPRAERIWVTITQRRSFFRSYKGKLQTQPVFISNLGVGSEIAFQPHHIARTIIKKSDPRWIDYAEKKALVSKMCLEPGGIVRWLYRQTPDRDEDSGWRMFSGLETPEYNEDPANIRIANVDWLLDRDPTLLEPLKHNVGVAFERKEKNQPWARLADWNPPD